MVSVCIQVADTLSAAAESVPEGVEGEGAPAALRSLRDGLTLTRAQLTQVLQHVSEIRYT